MESSNNTKEVGYISADVLSQSVFRRMWINCWLLSLIIYDIFLLYGYFQSISQVNVLIGQAAAATASVMIGSSLALSGFCYYFDFLDTKLAYRKYLGLVGFWLALIYSLMLLWIEPEKYFYGFINNFWSADFILGLSAMAILTFMAMISNNRAMKRLGVANWRRGLRLGYLAYGMLIIRAYVLEKDIWWNWLQSLTGLPPMRLVITLLAIGVLVLRGSMLIYKLLKSKKAVVVSSPLPS